MGSGAAKIIETEVLNATVVRIDGDVNEHFEVPPKRRGIVILDLEAVKLVTSFGVHRWMTALQNLGAEYYCFIGCPPAIMDQFNSVYEFGQRGELVSFFAPHRCTGCNNGFQQLIDLRTNYAFVESEEPPPVPCPKCSAPAEFDDDPDLYLNYVRSAPRPQPPAAASAAIDKRGEGPTAAAPRRFTLRKDVNGPVTGIWCSGYLDKKGHFRRMADGLEGQIVVELSDVDGISDDGLVGLAGFLRALTDGAQLVRVPPDLVRPLASVLGDCPGVRVASVRLPFQCATCNQTRWGEFDAAQLHTLITDPARTQVSCPQCIRPLSSALPPALAQDLTDLPLALMEPSVELYLRARSGQNARSPLTEDPMRNIGASASGPGPLIHGKYQVVQQLGEGGMGEVFLARHVGPENFAKLVVLKRIRRDKLQNREIRDLFLREASIAARLSHPNIVQIYALERVDDEYMMVMEYVNGIDLAHALQLSRESETPWPVELVCRIIAELCAGLHAAHSYIDENGRSAPIVHRDVSPQNVLLAADGQVKLTDFGIAVAAAGSNDPTSFRGKEAYASPEQLRAAVGQIDARSDIYAAGAVMFESLTLRPFIRTQTPSNPARLRSNTPLPHPPQLYVFRSGLSPLLQAIFEKAVQPDPDQRYRSAHQFELDLQRVLKTSAGGGKEDLASWTRRLMQMRSQSSSIADRTFSWVSPGAGTGETVRDVHVDRRRNPRNGGQ